MFYLSTDEAQIQTKSSCRNPNCLVTGIGEVAYSWAIISSWNTHMAWLTLTECSRLVYKHIIIEKSTRLPALKYVRSVSVPLSDHYRTDTRSGSALDP